MDLERYEEIIKKGEKTEWYGIEVPIDLVNNSVRMAAENLSNEIDKLESELDVDVKGTKHQSKRGYIDILKRNLQNLPYTFNGDVLLVKKKRIEAEMKPKEEKKRTSRRTKKSVKKDEVVIEEKSKTPTKKGGTKNSDLIFGKK